MKFDSASAVEEVIWTMKLAEQVRAADRVIINNQFNGDPPNDPEMCEENGITVNYNDLEGPNFLAHARRQWNTAFLNTENFFTVTLDSGTPHKRGEWGRSITRHANRGLKQDRMMMEQIRSTGGNVMLHGPGMSTWDGRRKVVSTPLMVGSVLIPSETNSSFDNLTYIAFFREWTPAKLYEMTHGPRVDPGWQMDLVDSQIKYISGQVQKQPNAAAFEAMPEKMAELGKQDLGLWGSDAVPTIDCWDFYFLAEDGNGWNRRTVLDWGDSETDYASKKKPDHQNKEANGKFLYTSGNRKYASKLSEIFHCNMGDLSAVFPQKFHSIRALGWLLWGVAHLQNLLHCRFNEAVFKELMWFFRVANGSDLQRLKVANFTNLGVIPAGITEILAKDRYTPNMALVEAAFNRNRSLMEDSAASYTQKFDTGAGGKDMRELEVLARLNQTNAMVSGMLTLAYTYEDYKYIENCRRLCIKIKPDPIAAEFRKGCLRDGVPEEMIDSDRWRVQSEKILGAGNKTLALSQIQYLNSVRKNLGPDAQRRVDHMGIEINLDSPQIAEELAPVESQKTISNSMHDAQLSTERLMRGLPMVPRPDMVYEDYVMMWLADLELMVNRAEQNGGMAKPEELLGWHTMADEIEKFMQIIAQDPEEKPKVKEYGDRLGKVMNMVKAFEQRLQQQAKAAASNGNGADPKDAAKVQAMMMQAQVKAKNAETSHAARTAQKQVSFEMQQQQNDRKTNADIRRENAKAAHEIIRGNMKSLNEPTNENENSN